MTTRRTFLGAAGGAAFAQRRAAAKRPNIVIVLADDMGYSDLGCYGSEIDTPNLDGLAQRGVKFTNFQNTARCCPTRSSLLTGLYSHQAGVGHMVSDNGYPAYRGEINKNCVTIAEALKQAGYRTGMAGKYHVCRAVEASRHNWPMQRGFDSYFGALPGGGNYFAPTMLVRGNDVIQPSKDFYYTEEIAKESVRVIESHGRGASNPFFLYSAFTAPHWPLHAREREIAKYADRYRTGWDKMREERWARMLKLGAAKKEWGLAPRDPAVPAWDTIPETQRAWQIRRMAVHAAMIDSLDQGIGKIMTAIDSIGERDNTLIMFLSDNGASHEGMSESSAMQYAQVTLDGRPVRRGNNPSILPGPADTFQSFGREWTHLSNTPFRLHKHWVHEGGISTPLIAHWPNGIAKPNRIDEQHGHVIDLMATAVDVAGAEYPKTFGGNSITPLEGKSLKPILEGKRRPGHSAVFWEHEGNRAVRMGKHKLVAEYKKPWELYDIEKDRGESKDLAATDTARVKSMESTWRSWADRCGVMDYDTARKGKPSA